LIILQKRVHGLTEGALERFVIRAKKKVGLRGAVSILITSSREMRELNYRFRRKDEATDVLSFPALRGVVTRFAGDVAISAEIAAENAKRLGHSPAEEVKILALHGVLHLSGYDHERDHGQMARTEERLRKEMKLPAGLIERREGGKAINRKDRQGPQSAQRKATELRPVQFGQKPGSTRGAREQVVAGRSVRATRTRSAR
jgi:probable rRNA maturation factor